MTKLVTCSNLQQPNTHFPCTSRQMRSVYL